MRRFLFLLAAIWLMPNTATAEDIQPGRIIDRVNCLENPDKSYALYLPSNYSPDRGWPLLMLFEPASRAPLPLRFFEEAAETWGFIVACTYDTPNYTPWEENRLGAEAMWNDLLQRFKIDNRRMYVGGLSGGARMASRVAMATNQTAGLIACGAGLWGRLPGGPKLQFEVISTVGNTDFNYLELLDLEKELDGLRLANRRLIFDGGHLWPGKEVCFEVLAWLQVRAYRKGLISEDQLRPQIQMDRRMAEARALEDKGLLPAAVMRYKQLEEDLAGLVDMSAVREKTKALQSSKAYKKQVKQEKRAVQMERKLQRELVSRLKYGESKAGKEPMTMRAEYAWWKKQGIMLRKDRDNENNGSASRSARRLIAMLRANFYETTIYYLREQEYHKVLFLHKVGQELAPESPWPHYNQAVAHVGLKQIDKAFQALERALEKGFDREAQMTGDENLTPLRGDPRFRDLLRRMKKE